MIFGDEEVRKPEVFCMKTFVFACVLHVVVFLLLWLFSICHFKAKETVIPIDLVFEAPPDEVAPDEPAPEPPKPELKEPDPPPVVDEKLDAVVKIREEKKPEEKKPTPPKEKPKPEPEKPKEPPKPEKTREQLKKEREEKLRKMRDGAKVVKNPKPTPVAGTGAKLDPNWKKLLASGYKPSDHTELAGSEEQRCYSLIKAAFYDKWNRPPWTDTLREMVLRVYFGPNGRVVSFRMEKSSGDPKADQTVLRAAKDVRVVFGLSEDFIEAKKMSGVPIRFKVTP